LRRKDDMLGQFLITFREALEAALITAIIMAYLVRTKRGYLTKYVMHGLYLAVAFSIVLGAIIWAAYGSISDSSKVLFEGVAALIAVVVLTSMIFWMATKGKEIKKDVEKKVGDIVTRGAVIGLIMLAFVLVFREGLETVLFLTPFLVTDAAATFGGAILGILSGLVIAYLIFKVGMKIDIRKFFYYTSVLLIFLAAGLAGYGIHELIEYNSINGGNLGWFSSTAYSLDIASDSVFHHKGAIGSMFAVMFGYTVKAEWGRVLVHLGYLIVVFPLIILLYKSPEKLERIIRIFNKIKTKLTAPFSRSKPKETNKEKKKDEGENPLGSQKAL
jgi:high-affinity iron transporter